MRPISDPALLAQLEGPQSRPVTDPALLQQLETPAPSLPPPVPPPWPEGTKPPPTSTLIPREPTAQPLPPPGTPGPEPQTGLPIITSEMLEKNLSQALRPSPYMQAALEGAGIGALSGGLPAAARVAAEMVAGTKAAEVAQPHIERALPGEDPLSAVGRWVLEQGAFMLPGLGAEIGAAGIRERMPVQPTLETAPAGPVPEQPALAAAGELKAPEPVPSTKLPDITPQGTGRTVRMFSTAEPGRTYEARYRVVPLDKLKVDDPSIQPRDPNRIARKQRIEALGRTLSGEEYLTGEQYLDRGAAIVGSDFKVESGNTRISGIRFARQHEPGLYERFQAYQADQAAALGIDPQELARVKDPVIVRERVSDVPNRMKFAEEANARVAAGMGTAETAAQDARNLSPEVIDALEIGESQSVEQALTSPRNAPVVRAFMETLPPAERATLLTADAKELSPAGLNRIKAALLAHVFPGEAGQQLTRNFLESTDTGVRNVESGIFSALPHLAKAEDLMASGARPAVSLADDIARAVGVLTRLRGEGVKVEDYLRQQTLGGRELTPFQEQLLDFFGKAKSAKQVREPLIRYAQMIRDMPPTGQAGFAGMEAPPPTTAQLWETAKKPPQAGLFGSERGAFTLPELLAKPAQATHDAAVWVGKGIAPTAFATDEALNAVFGKRGEWIEADRFLYNQMSRGNEAFWDRMIGQQGVGAIREFMGRLSRGERQPTEELQKLADFYRQADDAAALGASRFKEVPYLRHHFPGLFTKPEEAERWFESRGRRPMEGTKGFFNKKKWRDFEEAVAPKELGGGGLEPVSWNPEVLWRTYLEDVRKFNAARAWFEDRKDSGHLAWRPQGAPMPKGKAAINDQITKRYFPPDAVPVVFKRENLQAALRKYVQTLTRLSQRVSETTRTETTGSTTAEGKPTNVGKIEARVREALIHRGFSTGETEQFIGRLKSAGATGADAAKEVVREITERIKTIERTTAEVMNLPPEVTLKGRVATQKFIPAGEWVVDENEARVINNIFSQDFIRSNPGLRGVLLLNAKMNALQLGFSAFHITNEFGNSWGTKTGHVAAALARGKPLRALGQLARVPFAPLEHLIRGHRYWNDPGMTFDVLSPIRQGMQLTKPTGAFAPGSAWEEFARMVRQQPPARFLEIPGRRLVRTAVRHPFKGFGAVVDATMAPIFQYGVPRMKVGAYLDVLADEMDRNAPAIAEGRVNPKTLARQIVEQIDNRMGMVNYDLWAWNRTFKTGMQLIFRAPGWNFGYGKAGVQGLADIARGRFTPAAQFVVGTALATAAGAEIYQFLHTGKHVENVTDILFPRNGKLDQEGNELRIRFPGPLKDAWGLSNDLVGTVFNKMSPGLNILWRAFAPENFGGNKDFFGDYIRNRADPWPEQGQQLLTWLVGELTPFSLQQYQRIHGYRPEQLPPMPSPSFPITETEAEAYAGFTKAPREVIEGPQGRELSRLLQQHTRPMGPRTPEQKLMDERKRQAQEEIRAGGPRPTLDALRKEGAFPTAQALRQFILNAQRTGKQKMLRRLPKRFRPAELPSLGPTPP